MASPGDATTTVRETKQNRSRLILFLLLIVATTVPLFVPLSVPNKPVMPTIDLYTTLMAVPNGSTVLLQSDWTNSTRAESGGEFQAIMRILMRKDCKLAYYSVSDPQAPEVAKDTLLALNEERKAKGERVYKQWDDFVSMGFFPNAEGANNAMAADLRKAWAGKKDIADDGGYKDVFESPVLANVHSIKDIPLAIMVTGTSSFSVFIERMSGKMPIIALVTGVMGPESQVYYASGQIQGLATGMQGVYDLETLMENGVNTPGKDGKAVVEVGNHAAVAGFPGEKNFDKGRLYYPTLHVALLLLIITVIVGNVQMFAAKRRNR
jgi:hypothetical protein